MGYRNPDVFIKMKAAHPVPVDIRLAEELVEHVELGSARSKNDVGLCSLTQGFSQESGAGFGRFLPCFFCGAGYV